MGSAACLSVSPPENALGSNNKLVKPPSCSAGAPLEPVCTERQSPGVVSFQPAGWRHRNGYHMRLSTSTGTHSPLLLPLGMAASHSSLKSLFTSFPKVPFCRLLTIVPALDIAGPIC